MTVLRLEELSAPAVDALDRSRTLAVVGASPLEQHGPHLPVGVDYLVAGYLAETVAHRVVARRPEWTVVLTPTLPLGSFTFDGAGTIGVRQRVVRDAVADYGRALARAGFRYILVSNGHAGPGHLVALEEAAALVSRRHGVAMASFTGHMAWEFFRGRYLARIEAALGRPLTGQERRAFADDAHGGWWETSLSSCCGRTWWTRGIRDCRRCAIRCCAASARTTRRATVARATWATPRAPTSPSRRRPSRSWWPRPPSWPRR